MITNAFVGNFVTTSRSFNLGTQSVFNICKLSFLTLREKRQLGARIL